MKRINSSNRQIQSNTLNSTVLRRMSKHDIAIEMCSPVCMSVSEKVNKREALNTY